MVINDGIQNSSPSRRQFLFRGAIVGGTAISSAGVIGANPAWSQEKATTEDSSKSDGKTGQTPQFTGIGLGFGTYGMRGLSLVESIRQCGRIGYDGIEISLLKGWVTDPSTMTAGDRTLLGTLLTDHQLEVPSLLESLPCLRSPKEHQANLSRLKAAVELACELNSGSPPIVQSIVGGSKASWLGSRTQLASELRDWAEVGARSGVTICFKPHASHLVNTPERALWLINEIQHSSLKVVYDYSHFSLEGLGLKESLQSLLPVVPYLQVKDSRGTPSDHEYLLPGDGTTDYPMLLKTLVDHGYSGFVNVEVSSMIHRLPGYDPVATAELCFGRLKPVFRRQGVQRQSA